MGPASVFRFIELSNFRNANSNNVSEKNVEFVILCWTNIE